ncbi:MAG: zinc ABC transporter [Robiginitomaculum sp.]|nr:MAG: zinc ABC transporter [Robiginitomaculum sp.]
MANQHRRRSNHSGHAPQSANTRALKITGWLTGVYFLIELGIGIYTGSISVLSDAFHTFSAVGGVILAFVAAQIARRPADRTRTFGSNRAEVIGALLNGGFLLIMAILVFVMGTMRLGKPIDLPTTPMLLAAFGGLITEVISIRLLYQGQKESINLRGAFWHVLQTLIGSLLIIVSALVIRFTGFNAIDPLLGMAFGIVLVLASIQIIREAVGILMENTPIGLDLDALIQSLKKIQGVKDIHHVHAWVLVTGRTLFSAHIHVDEEQDTDTILHAARDILRQEHDIYFATLQVETRCQDQSEQTDIDFIQLNSGQT